MYKDTAWGLVLHFRAGRSLNGAFLFVVSNILYTLFTYQVLASH